MIDLTSFCENDQATWTVAEARRLSSSL